VGVRVLSERLEMLLVLQWLDEGAPEHGAVALSLATAASELEVGGGRTGLLAVMGALGQLEERGAITVAWPSGRGRDARITLSDPLRRDAERLFGARDTGPR
jgi:hypothetical protein